MSVFSYNTRLVPKFSYKAQLSPPHSSLPGDELKWVCNLLKVPYGSLPPSLTAYGKKHGFYQITSVQVQSAAAAIRASWSTVNNWQYWYDFLSNKVAHFPSLFLSSLSKDFFPLIFGMLTHLL